MDGGGRVVFALNSKKADDHGRANYLGAEERRVLPRPLRRVVRFGLSLETGVALWHFDDDLRD